MKKSVSKQWTRLIDNPKARVCIRDFPLRYCIVVQNLPIGKQLLRFDLKPSQTNMKEERIKVKEAQKMRLFCVQFREFRVERGEKKKEKNSLRNSTVYRIFIVKMSQIPSFLVRSVRIKRKITRDQIHRLRNYLSDGTEEEGQAHIRTHTPCPSAYAHTP